MKLIVVIIFLVFMSSCSKGKMTYNVLYDDDRKTSIDSLVQNEEKSIVFTTGFDETPVQISNSTKTLLDEEITSDHITGMAYDFIFIPDKDSGEKVVLNIDGSEKELTKFSDYRYVYITRRDNNIIELEYSNRIWLFD